MKFEGIQFKVSGGEPEGLKDFFSHYSLVNRFIIRLSNEKITTVENIGCFDSSPTIVHGVSNRIRHNLGYIPKTVVCNGRVDHIRVIQKAQDSVTITPKLHTVLLINPVPNIATNRVVVSDTSFFNTGDSVNIGGVITKINGIDGSTLILGQSVVYSASTYTLSLASETVDLFLI